MLYQPYPPYIVSGSGSHIIDEEGRSYVDWMLSFGAISLGHAHPVVVQASNEAVSTGVHFAASTSVEVELAELICKLAPSAEKVRFCNSGTEAVMAGIRLARGHTGRRKILKFEGHYHGWSDSVLVSSNPQRVTTLGHPHDPVGIVDSSGIPPGAVEDTIVVPWNDVELLRRVMRDRGREIACVITEGVMANVGVIPPADGYLQEIERLCREYDALFFLDETVTGFRLAPGGCAEIFGVNPDLVCFGKALGQGFPFAALCGRAAILDGLAWGKVMHFGTSNACRSVATVALASLRFLGLNNNAGFKQLSDRGESLADEIRDVCNAQHKHAVICQNVGSLFQIFFTDLKEIRSFRDVCASVDGVKFRRFANLLRSEGVYINPSSTLHSVTSVSHTDADAELTVLAIEETLKRLD
jgi:glutamate-1-semialdehyde 2,1-aminomutase